MKNILIVSIITLIVTGCINRPNDENIRLKKELELTQEKLDSTQQELTKYELISSLVKHQMKSSNNSDNILTSPRKDSFFLSDKEVYYKENSQLDEAKLKFDSIYSLKELDNIPKELPIDGINKSKIIGFGTRIHPIFKIKKFHKGIDIPTDKSYPVKSTISGTVNKIEMKKAGYGRHVVITSEEKVEILFAHLDSIFVEKGAKITKNQIIGKTGSTGTSTAPHLHYEIRIKGELVNPLFVIYDVLNKEEREIINSSNISPMD
jgi:murein DD-endopeptidase MepM/ murein hydrolase activator NlpD